MRAYLLAPAVLLASTASAQVAVGTYLGDGVDNRAITGLGFSPLAVLIKSEDVPTAIVRTRTLVGDKSKDTTDPAPALAVYPNLIQSIDADGFTLGNAAGVNWASQRYHYFAIRPMPGETIAGSYVGDGTDNRAITGLGFSPAYLLVLGENQTAPDIRTDQMATDQSSDLNNSAGPNRIQRFLADGFEVGTAAQVNAAGVTYHYVALRAAAGRVATGSYVGNGADDRNISAPFLPTCTIITGPTRNSVFRTSTLVGDSSLYFRNLALSSNVIQSVSATGFQVGTASGVNSSGITYFWTQFAAQKPQAAACGADAECASGVCADGVCCDRACTGACLSCAGNGLAADGTCTSVTGRVCRAAVSTCDQAEVCTSSSVDCPPDAFAPSSVTCRASTGACDAPEYCSGTSATCPNDAPLVCDGGVDGGSDAGVDAGGSGTDGGRDAGSSGGQDAGADGGPDAGSDGGVVDAGPVGGADGGQDAGLDAGPGGNNGGFDSGTPNEVSDAGTAPLSDSKTLRVDCGGCAGAGTESTSVLLAIGAALHWALRRARRGRER